MVWFERNLKNLVHPGSCHSREKHFKQIYEDECYRVCGIAKLRKGINLVVREVENNESIAAL